MKGFKLVYIIILALSISLGLTQTSMADPQTGFFQKDVAKDMFGTEIYETDSLKIGFFPPQADQPKVEELIEEPVKELEAQEESEKQEMTREEIIEKFGDPSENRPVLGEEDAPPELKGMLAALHIGDEKLAFEYAKMRARYMLDFKRRTHETMGIIGKAYEVEGLEDGEGWTTSPMVRRYDHLVKEEETQQDTAIADGNSYVENVDATARELIAKAKQDFPKIKTAEPQKELDEQAERKKLRASFLKTTPRDPQGMVDIYVFIRVQDKHSIIMGKEFEMLYKNVKDNPKINFSAFSIEPEIPEVLAQYKLSSGVSFDILDGTKIFDNLGIQSVPATMLISPNTGKAVVEEGLRRFYYLDERIKAMQGVAK